MSWRFFFNDGAQKVRDVLAMNLVTQLPGSPTDGQVIAFQDSAMATAGVVWEFRYRTGGGTYKWEFAGGSSLLSTAGQNASDESYAATTAYADGFGSVPQVTVPLAGDYQLLFGYSYPWSSAGAELFYTPKFGGAAVSDLDGTHKDVSTSANGDVQGALLKTGLAASTLIKMQTRVSTAVTLHRNRQWLQVAPVRVG